MAEPKVTAPISEAEIVATLVRKHIAAQTVPVASPDGQKADVLVLPSELRVHDIEQIVAPYRAHPRRREGTAKLQDLASLIAHVNRFKVKNSAVFANRDMVAPSITAVLDYHDAQAPDGDTDATPRFCKHRAHYAFPLSDEWTAWKGSDGKMLDQAEFAEFLEDRIGDVMAAPDLVHGEFDAKGTSETPEAGLHKLASLLGGTFASPSKLMELSRGLAVHVGETVKQVSNLSTGEMSVQYIAAHSDDQGQPLRVPNLFLIGIPVFRAGALYQIAVRLRYRVIGGSIKWAYQLYRTDKVFEHAFNEACDRTRTETALPLFIGAPEA